MVSFGVGGRQPRRAWCSGLTPRVGVPLQFSPRAAFASWSCLYELVALPALGRMRARARTIRGLPKSSFPPQDGVIARLDRLTCLLVSYWPLASTSAELQSSRLENQLQP